MKADSQRHDEQSDDGNFPEIAATLQSRQAERFDDVQSHQQDKQHRQNFGHGDTSPLLVTQVPASCKHSC